jgi:uncharacterized 2Fe-2S/4Fe-4S cluster protein (DUF4445 family)
VAGYLLDLTTGETLGADAIMNPQIPYGEDVMARITHALQQADGRDTLQQIIVEGLNHLAQGLCTRAGRRSDEIAEAVVVGNTTMHHLFLGLPVRQLGLSPYVPAVADALNVKARDLGLALAPGAYVHLLPNIGYAPGYRSLGRGQDRPGPGHRHQHRSRSQSGRPIADLLHRFWASL